MDMTTVCPKCGHAWWKHSATYFQACIGNAPNGRADDACGCEYTKEQAEREAEA